jgi:DNA polymerase III sliding clamp (beta) subunit (PCNA family)
MNGDQVSFGFNGKLEASLLREVGKDEYAHIVMPLKS